MDLSFSSYFTRQVEEIIIISSDDEEQVVETTINNSRISNEQEKSAPHSSKPNQTGRKTQSSVECIDIDDDDDAGGVRCHVSSSSKQAQVPVQNQVSPRDLVISAIDHLVRELVNFLRPDEQQRVKDEYLRLLSLMDLTTSSNKVLELITLLRKVPHEIKSNPTTKWSQLASVQKCMGSNQKSTSKKSTPKQKKTKKQVEIPKIPKNTMLMTQEEKKKILEHQLEKLANRIKENDAIDVDLDDEDNSAFLLRDKLMRQWMKAYELYCKGLDLNPSLDRTIEKKIKLSHDPVYPEISTAIEKYMNSKEMNFIPQYSTIEDIVGDVNMLENLNIPDVSAIAQPLYKEIVDLVHSHRRGDIGLSVLIADAHSHSNAVSGAGAGVNIELVDPCEYDEELRKKLEENSKQAKSEKDVFDLFIQKQMETMAKDRNDGDDDKYETIASGESGDEISDNEDDDVLNSVNSDEEDENMDEEPSTSPTDDELEKTQNEKTQNEKKNEEAEIIIIDD